MMTLEQAINRLEDMVSGRYKQTFPKSELRTHTKESAEQLKFNFMTLLKVEKPAIRAKVLENIMSIVLDNTLLPVSWQKKDMKDYFDYCRKKEEEHEILQYPEVVEECIECCNVILEKIEHEAPLEDDALSIQELNRIYYHKFLYFRDNKIGSQYVWVQGIHRDDEGHFAIDGTVIFTNGVNNTIGLYDVENHPVEDFYCFGNKECRFTRCMDLDEALRAPMDTRLKNHVVSTEEVAEDILFTFTWFYEIHIPDLAKILKTIKFR